MTLPTSLTPEQLRDRVEMYVEHALQERGPDQYNESEIARQKCIDGLLRLFEVPDEPQAEPQAEVKLIELVGEFVALSVRYEGGFVGVNGRVSLVEGGPGVDTVLWVDTACVPVDAVVYRDLSGERWVFDLRDYNRPNAPKPGYAENNWLNAPKPPTHTDEAVRLSQEPASREP